MVYYSVGVPNQHHVKSNMKLTSLVLLFSGLSWMVVIPALLVIWRRSRRTISRPDCVLFFPEKSARNSPGSSSVSRLIDVLNSARRSLDVCVYTISSQALASALINAHQRSVKVRVITDNEQMANIGSRIMQLRKAGIQVRDNCSGYFMHHKFAIVDRSQLVNGSLNWTEQGLYCNQENVVITSNDQVVLAFGERFQQLWDRFNPDVLFSVDCNS